MIRVHAAVSAPACERARGQGLGFDSAFGSSTLLGRAVESLRSLSEADAVFVLTDDARALEGLSLPDAAVKVLPASFFTYGLPLFSKEHWLIAQALHALDQAQLSGDIFVHLSWRAPLAGPMLLHRLYHGLLEDRVAARTVAISPEDPNLYTPYGPQGRLFPVWSDLGQDRQRLPQLYRPAGAVACHMRRLRAPIPETKGIVATSLETLLLSDLEDAALAAFIHAEQSRLPAAGQTVLT